MNAAIRTRLLLALAFIGLAALGALLAPAPVPVTAVNASHAAPTPPSAGESLRTDI